MSRKNITSIGPMILIPVLFPFFSAVCSMPGISDLTIVSGHRGLAVSISSGCVSGVRLEKNTGASVHIFLGGCAYESGPLEYDRFAPDAAVRSVSLKNRKDGAELIVFLRTASDSVIRTHLKGNSWIGLLSSKSFPELNWSLSDLQQKRSDKISGTEESRPSSSRALENIRLLNRSNVSELFFDFGVFVEYDLKRSKDTLIIRFYDAGSAAGSTSFTLPEGTVFKSIELDKNKTGNGLELTARVFLKRGSSGQTIIVNKKERGISLLTSINGGQKALLWNSSRGFELAYDFYRMPEYEIDLNSLLMQISKDSSMFLSGERLFTIHGKKAPDGLSGVSARPLEESVPKTGNLENEHPSSTIRFAQQITSDSITRLKVNLGSEMPAALTEELPGHKLFDTIPAGDLKNMIRYNNRSGRDPFLPYISSMESDLGLPYFENLCLVGILFDVNDKIALLEDKKSRRPFTMREEDRIEKGKVLRIYRDRIVFLITEYGISRSVFLRLAGNSSKQEAGIR